MKNFDIWMLGFQIYIIIGSIISFVLIAKNFEYPTGILLWLFETEAMAILIFHLVYILAVLIDDKEDENVFVLVNVLAHTVIYGIIVIYVFIRFSKDTINGFDEDIYPDNYRVEVLVAASVGVLTVTAFIVEILYIVSTFADSDDDDSGANTWRDKWICAKFRNT